LLKLSQLEKEADILYNKYVDNPTMINHGEWANAYKKALSLKWELYPSTKPAPSSSETIEDLGERIEDLEDAVRDIDK